MSTVELAVLAPALMMLCMLIIQFGLWFNARQAALAAAQAGAQVARQEAATDPGWRSAAQTAATKYYKELDTKLLGKLTATATGNPATSVYVTVSGPLGYSVFPFFGLHLTVSATAGGPVECFRPAVAGGACLCAGGGCESRVGTTGAPCRWSWWCSLPRSPCSCCCSGPVAGWSRCRATSTARPGTRRGLPR